MNSNTYITPEEADAYYEHRTMKTNLADIDSLQAGRELDALVHVYVLGGNPEDCFFRDGAPRAYWGNSTGPDEDTFYSTDIAMAWLVVEKLRSQGFDVWLHVYDTFTSCEFFKHYPEKMESVGCARAITAPLAICRAALKVIKTAWKRAKE